MAPRTGVTLNRLRVAPTGGKAQCEATSWVARMGRLLGLSVGCTQIWVSGDGILHRKRLLSVTGGTIGQMEVGIKGNVSFMAHPA